MTEVIDLTDSFSSDDSVVLTSVSSDGNHHPECPRSVHGHDFLSDLEAIAAYFYKQNLIKPLCEEKKLEAKKNEPLLPFDESLTEEERERCESPYITIGDCPICWDELGVNPLAATKCGHVYCMECIKQSLSIEKKCPTCRTVLKGKDAYHPLYLNN